MSNPGKATDAMLDALSVEYKRISNTRDWLSLYAEAGFIDSAVAEHLGELLDGFDRTGCLESAVSDH